MSLLDQRGFFWWNDEILATGVIAPASRVPGRCQISDEGRISLELDGYLPGPHGPMVTADRAPITKCIQGLLKESGDRILLSDLVRSGGRFSTNGISYEKYVAMHALVGGEPFAPGVAAPKYDTLEIRLTGFEEWLRLGSIKFADDKQIVSATYDRQSDLTYHSEDDTLSIIPDFEGNRSGMLLTHELSLKLFSLMRLTLRDSLTIRDLQVQFGMLEDLLKVLTGSDYGLSWPQVCFGTGIAYKFYFQRMKSQSSIEPPSVYDFITYFQELHTNFGKIWSAWKAKREEYGPGLYLYLGTRRGMRLYEELKFVNLIFGLEAFHRKKAIPADSAALTKKIERIVGQIVGASDQKWLRSKLKHFSEPPLSERLFAIFSALPTDIERDKLQAFSKACADLRNDISHFGGQKHDNPYSDFIHSLERKSSALTILYQILILQEVGIDAAILKRWLYKSPNSHYRIQNFVDVGLLDPDILSAQHESMLANFQEGHPK